VGPISGVKVSSGGPIDIVDVPEDMAKEMAAVGIVPTLEPDPPGKQFLMGGVIYIAGPEVTRGAFLDAVKDAGLDVKTFALIPAAYKFQRITKAITWGDLDG
jgi:hypothetical protein